MHRSWRAFTILLSFGFKPAPFYATCQLVTEVLSELGAPLAALGASLLVNAAISGDLSGEFFATTILAFSNAITRTSYVYNLSSLFMVFDRAGQYADRRLMELIGGAPGLAHHEQSMYLDQIEQIRNQRGLLSGMVNAISGLLRVIVLIGLSAALLANINPVLLLLPVLGVVSMVVGKWTTDIWERGNERASDADRRRQHLFQVATEPGTGKELRVFDSADEVWKRHRSAADHALRIRNDAEWKSAILQCVDGLGTGCGYVGAVALVLWQAINGSASAGDVVLAFGLAGTLNGIVATAVAYSTFFMRVLRIGRKFVWLEDYAASSNVDEAHRVAVPSTLSDGIALRDVFFRYPDSDINVLDGISVNLPAGSVVALVGENGAGKTTLVKLLCRFYEPNSGSIKVDDLDLRLVPTDEWRGSISAVYQDHANFEFVVRESVGLGDLPRIHDESAIRRAVAAGKSSDVIESLPKKLDTRLGSSWDHGIELSGGQWQRIALSRGLMRSEPVLQIFDEPTSALDPDTEHQLFQGFADAARVADQSTVTILVSHRFSTVRMADLIIVLEHGRVVEQGSHLDLIASGGTYANLFELQADGYR